MSFLNSYGKVEESDQAMFEVRRKTRKRITIIALSTVVLVGVVCGAVFGTVAHNNNNNAHDNNNNNDSNDGTSAPFLSNSVKAVCDVTLYTDACYSSLGPLVHEGQVRPEKLFLLSVEVALAEASRVVKYFSDDDHEKGFLSGLNVDNRTKEGFRNCVDLLGLAVDHLNGSLASGGKSSLLDVIEDLRTWLSAAGTYHQTCIDGFEKAEESLKSSVISNLKNSTEFTSNSLAIVTWLNKVASSVNLRRLLSTSPHKMEEPKWLHSKDRKLLQTNDLKRKADIVVAKDGSGKFKTITEALKHVPEKSDKRTVIYVKKGVYNENVRVEKTKWNVMIVGDGMSATIVSGSLNFVDGTPTFSTATFAVFGRNFIARDMGFRNTAGPQKHQAVALMTSADQAIYYRCHIDAFQDTLYALSNRQFYRECDIYGTVDFIFGNSAVVLQNCNIFPRLPMQGQQNTITAQGKTDPNMNTGISIQNCNIAPFGNLSSVKTYLGRPWKNYSTTVFMQSTLGSFIHPNGWLPWVGDSAPDTIFYAEFQNVGPGSSTKNRVKWKGVKTISTKQASAFTVKAFLSGDRWIPASGAPFKSSM
ncbi:putative pectinesterase/pectinesterase inhibitor 24 [Cajanus cajan]|uniref:Pectinesterase n=1 Tax=Cajanus cajan TaxID=3821 RepID=A0A151RN23_CAJCA|nr:putative pectinesterase/pectinesterase inhibitor 24 [Cajanus cajan]KYP43936.1 Putative pectinesterase/pectinesterase inhibitor 24 [Cajanus cajan]